MATSHRGFGVAIAACAVVLATELPAPATGQQTKPRAAPERRECFEEAGQRSCANLTLGCPESDHACLTDDLTGAILRAGFDPELRYAAYLARGVIAARDRQISDAMADFETARSIRPELVTPVILIAQSLMDLGQPARALTHFNEAGRRAPGVPAILKQRAAARVAVGDVDGAIADLTEAIEIMRSGRTLPGGAGESVEVLLVARGEIWESRGDGGKARADFDKALPLHPESAPARQAMARLNGR